MFFSVIVRLYWILVQDVKVDAAICCCLSAADRCSPHMLFTLENSGFAVPSGCLLVEHRPVEHVFLFVADWEATVAARFFKT